jgi:hypothetical protein
MTLLALVAGTVLVIYGVGAVLASTADCQYVVYYQNRPSTPGPGFTRVFMPNPKPFPCKVPNCDDPGMPCIHVHQHIGYPGGGSQDVDFCRCLDGSGPTCMGELVRTDDGAGGSSTAFQCEGTCDGGLFCQFDLSGGPAEPPFETWLEGWCKCL